MARPHWRLAMFGLLLARLLLGLVYSALNPLGEAPDEVDHYAYVTYIGREHHLPEQPSMTQAKHPPLYHLLAVGMARLFGADMDFGFLRSNPDVGVTADAAAANFFVHTRLESWPWHGGALAMHLGRLISVLAGLILTAATFALALELWPNCPAGAFAAAAFVAFLPESLFIGGSMNNDMLAAMFSALALWWGKFGGAGHILLPTSLYLVWFAVIVLAALGWLRWVVLAKRSRQDLLWDMIPGGLILLLGTPTLVALVIIAYSYISLGTDQGRLLFPALALLALVIVGGLKAWVPKGHSRWFPATVTGLMGVVGVLGMEAFAWRRPLQHRSLAGRAGGPRCVCHSQRPAYQCRPAGGRRLSLCGWAQPSAG